MSGQTGDAFVGCNCKDARLVGLMQFDRGSELHENEIDMARDDVVQGRRSAFVRHVYELGAGDAFKQSGSQVRCGADALRGVVDLSWVRFDIGDELLRGLGRKVGTHQEHIGDRGHDRHRLELGGIEIHFLVEKRIDRKRRRLRGQQRISVGIRGEYSLSANIARGTCAVLDNDGLAEFLVETFSNDTRHGIDATPGRHADDDLDRLIRESGCGICASAADARNTIAEIDKNSPRTRFPPSRRWLMRRAPAFAPAISD